ncbi:MAG: hypothetical protein V7720_16125 [Halioglobus sp.]
MTETHLLIKATDMKNWKLIERVPALWIGIGISSSLIAVLLVTETALGRWTALLPEGDFNALTGVSTHFLRDIRLAIVLCLVIGYIPAALLHVLRNARRTVLVLQSALDCTVEECQTLAASFKLSARGLVINGLIGFALAFAAPYMVPPVQPEPWNPMEWSPEVAWHRILLPMILVWQSWLVYAVVIVSIGMSRVAKKLRHIDLLNLTPLAPFTHLGLTNALLLIGLLSIWSLMMLETGFGQIMILIGGITLVVTMLALLAPVGGVHKRIRQSKDAEINWVNREISKQLLALQTPDAGRRSGDMADHVAYLSLVERAPEWPFTTSTYTRLFLYLLIPVVFWGIGIVAEEIVQRALS